MDTPLFKRPSEESVRRVSGDGSEDDVDDFLATHDTLPRETYRWAKPRLFWAFLIFGLLNNVLYVIILSAALDLVPAETPKGIIAFFNVFPSLMVKVGWPLLSNGTIRYGKRVAFCTTVSWLGIVIIAFSSSVPPRLLGISLASLSSGLGELTFLQLTTTLPSTSASRTALGAWASGTGLAGVAGAGLWWLLRGLGVRGGLGLSSFLPLFFPLTYLVILPPHAAFLGDDDESTAYQPLSTDIDVTDVSPVHDEEAEATYRKRTGSPEVHLSVAEKLALLRPLLFRYMLSLCLVYIAEYVINSGVAPTLVFPLPTEGIWARLFISPRDYYPFWSLTYQTFVFISRSSLSLGLPAIPIRFLPLPTVVQILNLLLLSLQASHFILSPMEYTPPHDISTRGVDSTITKVFLLICLEGLCGGSAYVNTFYHVGRIGSDNEGYVPGTSAEDRAAEKQKRKLEREFRIGATGAADSCGILLASLISMPLEQKLCGMQVQQGRSTCRDL